jgi:hypothetical protein
MNGKTPYNIKKESEAVYFSKKDADLIASSKLMARDGVKR